MDTQRKTLDCPEACPADFYALMRRCWAHRPEDRPSFDALVLELPQLAPQLLVTVAECHNQEPAQLQFDKGDIIVLLDKWSVFFGFVLNLQIIKC